ncbi:RHS repeat-associated core domain-containing protein [Streptomyces profundus]|uniref:RHS repeat-associated core domain-containing protein n=1 Tax=Streptomyces profundus TaxID=2867410 RepID=UPI001D16EE73|nr:RHS repeat-associated core domain-containing protein [Streptomyces sp. MA3_2.13]UED85056.1 DUF6531 domain-containing protein [Streptomyces sp. MA3_2.13]
MDRDPTPGNPEEVRELADDLREFADDVGEALGKIRGLAGERAVLDWAGLSADTFRSEFDGVPDNLTKLEDSYSLCSQALQSYWPQLQTAQGMADRALDRAISAQADLANAQTALGDATDWVGRAGDEAERLQREGERDNVEPPDEADVRNAARDQQAAQAAAGAAQARVDDAEERLSAARQLAQDAQEMREEAARQCAQGIDEASDAGIQNRKWWQKAIKWVTDNWDTLVEICKVIVAVLGVVVMIIGGPLAWVVLAAALVVLADTLIKFAQGKAGLLDVAFAALDCIPGMKGLTTLGGLARGLRGAGSTGLRGIRQGALGLGRSMRRNARPMDVRVCRTDPIDMATGEMVMNAVDVELPGVLRFSLERQHVSSYRHGRWFGPSWASTLDQRLLLSDSGVQFFTSDGMALDYPVPMSDAEAPVFPVEGPRWGLSWDGTAGGTLTVRLQEHGHVLSFSPVNGRPAHELSLTAIADGNGNRVEIRHTEEGTPREITHSGGFRLGFTLSATQKVTEIRLLSAPDHPVLRSFGYDDQGSLSEVRDSAGVPASYTYDEDQRITGWQDRNGHWYRYHYGPDGRCLATEGMNGVLTSEIHFDDEERQTVFTDSLGRVTRFNFNDSFQLDSEIDPLGHTTRFEYDRYDQPVSVTDPMGRVTHYEYDVAHRLTAVVRPDSSRYVCEYDESGFPIAITEPDGSTWRQDFDSAGNRVQTVSPLGLESRFGYDQHGGIAWMVDAAGERTEVECDSAGLPVRSENSAGAATRVRRDDLGRPVEITVPDGSVTRLTWSLEGRLLTETDPEGGVQAFEWDAEGNRTTQTDAAGNVTRYEYGCFGALHRRVEPDGAVYSFERDTELNLLSVLNPKGHEWSYTYDRAGRLVAERDYDGRVTEYAYDACGERVLSSNALAQRIEYQRDVLGRVTVKSVDGMVTRYDRDANGRLLRAVNDHSELVLQRDANGRITAEICDGRELRIDHDRMGRPARRMTPSGWESVWTYGIDGRPLSLRFGREALRFTHDVNGRETGRHLDTVAALQQNWSPAGRLTRQRIGTASVREYDYRADGYPEVVDDSALGETRFILDPGGRVSRAESRHGIEEYAYDATGSLRSASWPSSAGVVETEQAGERHHHGTRLVRAGRTHYAYDDAGRLVRRRTRTLSGRVREFVYAWDGEDHLRHVELPDGSRWEYRYDPIGRRIEKLHRAPDNTERDHVIFTWDRFRLVEETTWRPGADRPDLITAWEWDEKTESPTAQLEWRPDDDRERLLAVVTDSVGTPQELVTEEGDVVWRNNSTLWGVPLGGSESVTRCPLRFPGQYRDEESGLHYNVFRYYDPETGRYLSPDPLGLEPAPHHYNYTPNPLVWADPYGLACTVVRHFTTRANYQRIMSGGGKDHIVLRASSPVRGHPQGVYVTQRPLSEILKKPNGFKKYLGLTREKSEHMIEFTMDGDLLRSIRGSRGSHVEFSPQDLRIPKENISYHGPTANYSLN